MQCNAMQCNAMQCNAIEQTSLAGRDRQRSSRPTTRLLWADSSWVQNHLEFLLH